MLMTRCGYCGRRRPKTDPDKREWGVTQGGKRIRFIYDVWHPGQTVCCEAQGRPMGGAKQAPTALLAGLRKALETTDTAAQTVAERKERPMPMLKKGEFTIQGAVTRTDGGLWQAEIYLEMQRKRDLQIRTSATATASNPHTAARNAIENGVRALRDRAKQWAAA